jgi:hypothetical protein
MILVHEHLAIPALPIATLLKSARFAAVRCTIPSAFAVRSRAYLFSRECPDRVDSGRRIFKRKALLEEKLREQTARRTMAAPPVLFPRTIGLELAVLLSQLIRPVW